MAVQPWDLEPEPMPARPELRLAPPPPARPRAVPALVFVALVASVLAIPPLRAATAERPAPQRWQPRLPSLASMERLPAVAPVPKAARPKSSEPAGGMLFVRCTSLWRANPDGSQQRRIVRMSGISSPAFAPNARTVAFLVGGREVWMAGADGSDPTRVTDLPLAEFGRPVTAINLAWSPDGNHLAFGLVDPAEDAWSGGSAIWSLDLRSGELTRVGAGWPTPAYGARAVMFPQLGSDGTELGTNGRKQVARRLSKHVDPVAIGFRNSFWNGIYARRVAVLHRTRGGLVLGIRRDEYRRRDGRVFDAPNGFRFTPLSRPSLSQDGRTVFVDLLDHRNELNLGMLDAKTGDWEVLDYAWGAAPSPAPAHKGPLGARRASDLAGDLLGNWRHRPQKVALLLGYDPAEHDDLIPFGANHMLGPPARDGDDWVVPATVFGEDAKARFAYRKLAVRVRKLAGRVTARPVAQGPVGRLRTIEDAAGLLRGMLGDTVVLPAWLPPGTRLNTRDWPVSGWSWDGGATGMINLAVPAAALGTKRDRNLTLAYGDEIHFNLGCGAVNDPEETDVDDQPALIDRLGTTRQVIWPATLEADQDATHSVYGSVPKDVLMRVANSF